MRRATYFVGILLIRGIYLHKVLLELVARSEHLLDAQALVGEADEYAVGISIDPLRPGLFKRKLRGLLDH